MARVTKHTSRCKSCHVSTHYDDIERVLATLAEAVGSIIGRCIERFSTIIDVIDVLSVGGNGLRKLARC